MPDLDGTYAIVLDRWLEEHDDHWPLTAVFDSLVEARAMEAYDGSPPAPVDRGAWEAPPVEPTVLLNEATLEREEGDIRRLESRTDG